MAENVFAELILEGRLKTLPELKRCYRSLAAKVHPDAQGREASQEPFLRLRRDFEEARGLLEAGGLAAEEPGPSPRREELYEHFEALVATGFPVDPSVRAGSTIYRERIRRFAALLKAYRGPKGPDFHEVERELYLIRGEDIVDNPLFGKIRLVLYNIVSWHWEPRAFTKSALQKWTGEIRPELESRGYPAALAFFSWLIEDLEHGQAL